MRNSKHNNNRDLTIKSDTAQCVHDTVGFSGIQKWPVVATEEYHSPVSATGHFYRRLQLHYSPAATRIQWHSPVVTTEYYSPVATTGEYLREKLSDLEWFYCISFMYEHYLCIKCKSFGDYGKLYLFLSI